MRIQPQIKVLEWRQNGAYLLRHVRCSFCGQDWWDVMKGPMGPHIQRCACNGGRDDWRPEDG